MPERLIKLFQQHNIDTVTQIAYTASAATTGAGLFTWLNHNAGAVGALCAIVGAAIAVATFFVNWWYKHQASKK